MSFFQSELPSDYNEVIPKPSRKNLETPASSVTLLPFFSHPDPKTIKLQCHDHLFQRGTLTDDETSQPLFHIKGPSWGKSWSMRRSVYDAVDTHLFDIRRHPYSLKQHWIVEDPAGKKIAAVRGHGIYLSRFCNLDLIILGDDREQGESAFGGEGGEGEGATSDESGKVREAANDREGAVAHLHQQDHSALTTHVTLGESENAVAEIAMTGRNNILFNEALHKDRSIWELRVSPMVDLSLVIVLALCRAEIAHLNNQG